jgi:hypothetical protein
MCVCIYQGRLVVEHPVVVGLGAGEHGEGAAEEVGDEDDDEERVDDAERGRYELIIYTHTYIYHG